MVDEAPKLCGACGGLVGRCGFSGKQWSIRTWRRRCSVCINAEEQLQAIEPAMTMLKKMAIVSMANVASMNNMKAISMSVLSPPAHDGAGHGAMPLLSPLCRHTSIAVWRHLLVASATASTANLVCKQWRAHVLGTYEQPLTLNSAMRCLPTFSRVHTLEMRDVGAALTNETLDTLAAALPACENFDFSGSVGYDINFTQDGFERFVTTLGARLRTYKQLATPKEIEFWGSLGGRPTAYHAFRPTIDMLKAVAAAPRLRELSVVLGTCDLPMSATKGEHASALCSVLNGHPTLETLTLELFGPHFMVVPQFMHKLRDLHLKTREGCGFEWPQGIWPAHNGFMMGREIKTERCPSSGSSFPALEVLTIDDHVDVFNHRLHLAHITGIAACFDHAVCTVTSVGKHSDIDPACLPWQVEAYCDNSLCRRFHDTFMADLENDDTSQAWLPYGD